MPVVVSVVATWLAGWLLVVQGAVSPATGGRSIALHRLTLAAYPWIGFAVLLAWIMFRTGMDTIIEGLLLALMLGRLRVRGRRSHVRVPIVQPSIFCHDGR